MRDAGKKDWKDPPANAWPKASSAERLAGGSNSFLPSLGPASGSAFFYSSLSLELSTKSPYLSAILVLMLSIGRHTTDKEKYGEKS